MGSSPRPFMAALRPEGTRARRAREFDARRDTRSCSTRRDRRSSQQELFEGHPRRNEIWRHRRLTTWEIRTNTGPAQEEAARATMLATPAPQISFLLERLPFPFGHRYLQDTLVPPECGGRSGQAREPWSRTPSSGSVLCGAEPAGAPGIETLKNSADCSVGSADVSQTSLNESVSQCPRLPPWGPKSPPASQAAKEEPLGKSETYRGAAICPPSAWRAEPGVVPVCREHATPPVDAAPTGRRRSMLPPSGAAHLLKRPSIAPRARSSWFLRCSPDRPLSVCSRRSRAPNVRTSRSGHGT